MTSWAATCPANTWYGLMVTKREKGRRDAGRKDSVFAMIYCVVLAGEEI